MKFSFYTTILCSFLVFSCQNASLQQDSAEATTKGFVEALKVKDFELARQYCTKDAATALMDFETNLKMISAEEKAALMSGFDMKEVRISCEAATGTTFCKTCCGPDSLEGEWELIQQDQKWLINTEIGI